VHFIVIIPLLIFEQCDVAGTIYIPMFLTTSGPIYKRKLSQQYIVDVSGSKLSPDTLTFIDLTFTSCISRLQLLNFIYSFFLSTTKE